MTNAVFAQLQHEAADLRARLDATRRNSAGLEQSLSECAPLNEEQRATYDELRRLYALVTTLESQRDQAMAQCNELIATVRKRNDRIKRLEATARR